MAPGYRERYAQLKKTEELKHELIEELLNENSQLAQDLEKTKHRLERDSDTAELYQQRSKEASAKFDTLQRQIDANAYCFVLIDGDCMNFRDQLVKNATAGGQDAAQLLQGAIADHLRSVGLCHDLKIVVHIYTNVHALMNTYRDAQLLNGPGDLDRFISSFNGAYPLLNFIDAGNGADCSSHKIGNFFRLHVDNIHCKHLIFGGSSNHGYARLLDTYIGNDSVKDRITLLEGPPFAREMSRTSAHFRRKTFPKVFRDSKIEFTQPREPITSRYIFTDRRASLENSTSANRSSPTDKFLETLKLSPTTRKFGRGYTDNDEDSSANRRTSDDNGSGYRAGGAQHEARRPSDYADRLILTSSDRQPRRESTSEKIAYRPEYFMDAPFGFIARNRQGQRVDVPLSRPAAELINEIKRRKLCNDHCLRGHCPNPFCKHEHAERLSKMELHVLRDVARSFPCHRGLRCDDKQCHSGHRCPVDPCGFNRDRICRYPPELHETDQTIVNKKDLDRLEDDARHHDESHVLGTVTRENGANLNARSPPLDIRRSRRDEPLYRNKSVTFNTAPGNCIKSAEQSPTTDKNKPISGAMPPPTTPTLSNGIATFSNSASSLDSSVPGPTIKIEPQDSLLGTSVLGKKRVGDEEGYQPGGASSTMDPRLVAQKLVKRDSGALVMPEGS